MKIRTSTGLVLLLCVGLVQAETTYRWVDREGKVHYGDRPPPPSAAKEVQQKKYAVPAADKPAPYGMQEATEKFPVTLYVASSCATGCKEARDYLKQRGIPFSEQHVGSAEEIDALRKRLGGGEAMVPVLQVGEKTSKGFLESAWAGLLDAAGYPKSKSAGR
jgi:glutaredoxin